MLNRNFVRTNDAATKDSEQTATAFTVIKLAKRNHELLLFWEAVLIRQ